jgi:hypothetical protein
MSINKFGEYLITWLPKQITSASLHFPLPHSATTKILHTSPHLPTKIRHTPPQKSATLYHKNPPHSTTKMRYHTLPQKFGPKGLYITTFVIQNIVSKNESILWNLQWTFLIMTSNAEKTHLMSCPKGQFLATIRNANDVFYGFSDCLVGLAKYHHATSISHYQREVRPLPLVFASKCKQNLFS